MQNDGKFKSEMFRWGIITAASVALALFFLMMIVGLLNGPLLSWTLNEDWKGYLKTWSEWASWTIYLTGPLFLCLFSLQLFRYVYRRVKRRAKEKKAAATTPDSDVEKTEREEDNQTP